MGHGKNIDLNTFGLGRCKDDCAGSVLASFFLSSLELTSPKAGVPDDRGSCPLELNFARGSPWLLRCGAGSRRFCARSSRRCGRRAGVRVRCDRGRGGGPSAQIRQAQAPPPPANEMVLYVKFQADVVTEFRVMAFKET
jgi:hypothetical protein